MNPRPLGPEAAHPAEAETPVISGIFGLPFDSAGLCGVAGCNRTARENAPQTAPEGHAAAPMGYKWGTLFLIPVGVVKGRPDVRRELVRLRFLQAGVDLQRDLRIRMAGQVLDALEVHL